MSRRMRREAEPIRPLVEELTPAPDPWDVCRRLAHLCRTCCFSTAPSVHPTLGRYSFVTADPFDWLRSWRGQSPTTTAAPASGRSHSPCLRERLAACRARDDRPACRRFRAARRDCSATTCAITSNGCRGRAATSSQSPDLAVGFYDWVIAFDHVPAARLARFDRLPGTRPGQTAAGAPRSDSACAEAVACRQRSRCCRGSQTRRRCRSRPSLSAPGTAGR